MTGEERNGGARPADARPGSWVDRWAPERTRPYLRLARVDRPIGTWLLLWPCWWSLGLATISADQAPDPWFFALFAAGAIVMRGAGCTYNDILDRDFDAQVARTRDRPIPSGQVSPGRAALFATGLLALGLLILLQFNAFAIALGAASLLIVAIYPLAKRWTDWPQIILGLAFNWGALLGWAAMTGGLALPALYLYAGGLFWTLGYDTIYAHQDKADDAIAGIRSTALRLGGHTRWALVLFYSAAALFFALAVEGAGGSLWSYAGVAGIAGHFAWQLIRIRIDDPDSCLMIFRSNNLAGWLLGLGILADATVA